VSKYKCDKPVWKFYVTDKKPRDNREQGRKECIRRKSTKTQNEGIKKGKRQAVKVESLKT
jgi:hypothetical protein